MNPMLHGFAGVLTAVCFAGLWQGVLLALLGAAMLRVMPRAAAAFRHGVLMALVLLAIGLPWLSLHHGASNGHALRLAPWVAVAIAACWGVGFAVRAVTLGIAWQHLRSVRRSAVPMELSAEELEGLRLDRRRLPRVCMSAAVDSPLIVGFFEPVLLLPEWLAPMLGAEELRQIVLHECEHLRRGDDWSNLGLHLALTLFPLNPALLWFNRRIGVQRELACDAAVVAATARPIDYAASLARMAEQRLRRNTVRLALAAWGRQSELSHRVHALLEQRRGWSLRQRTMAMGTISAAMMVSVAGLAHAPQFVRIEAPTIAIASNESLPLPTTPVVARPVEASHVRFMNASFVPKPATHVRRASAPSVTKQKAAAKIQPRALRPVAMQTSYEYAVAEMSDGATVRPAGFEAVEAVAMQTETPQADAPVRRTPVRVSPTYLAVPVASGWLLIQL